MDDEKKVQRQVWGEGRGRGEEGGEMGGMGTNINETKRTRKRDFRQYF